MRTAPGYGAYQARTTRVLPVVVLERAEPDGWQPPREVRTLADKLTEVHTWPGGRSRPAGPVVPRLTLDSSMTHG